MPSPLEIGSLARSLRATDGDLKVHRIARSPLRQSSLAPLRHCRQRRLRSDRSLLARLLLCSLPPGISFFSLTLSQSLTLSLSLSELKWMKIMKLSLLGNKWTLALLIFFFFLFCLWMAEPNFSFINFFFLSVFYFLNLAFQFILSVGVGVCFSLTCDCEIF